MCDIEHAERTGDLHELNILIVKYTYIQQLSTNKIILFNFPAALGFVLDVYFCDSMC